MTEGFSVHVDGLAKVADRLESLQRKMRRKLVVQSLREASGPMRADAKRRAPVRTGLVRRRTAIFASKIYNGRNGTVGVYLSVRSTKVGRGVRGSDPFYFKFLEGGWTTSRGNRIRRSFIGPAYEANKLRLPQLFRAALVRRMQQEGA